ERTLHSHHHRPELVRDRHVADAGPTAARLVALEVIDRRVIERRRQRRARRARHHEQLRAHDIDSDGAELVHYDLVANTLEPWRGFPDLVADEVVGITRRRLGLVAVVRRAADALRIAYGCRARAELVDET